MTIKQAVEYLAERDYPCSVSTVRKLVRAGRLRCRRIGVSSRGRMEFAPDRLDAFLAASETGQGAAIVEPSSKPRTPRPKRERPVAPAVKRESALEALRREMQA